MLIKLTAPFWPLLQHLPQRASRWEGVDFAINDATTEECDFWFVAADLVEAESARCDPANIVLYSGEPQAVKRFFAPAFLRQFERGMIANPHLRHPAGCFTLPPIPWRVGIDYDHKLAIRHDFDSYVREGIPAKTKLVSIVTSTKTVTAGQRMRSRVVEYLDRHHSDIVDVFGDDRLHISDKWDALAPYQYHLALENCRQTKYYTEKLTDAFLAGCLPLYYGAPDIADYFPTDSLVPIDVRNPSDVARQLFTLIEHDARDKRLSLVAEARRRVLHERNFFALIVEQCTGRPLGTKQFITVYPEKDCQSRLGRFAMKAANRLYAWPFL